MKGQWTSDESERGEGSNEIAEAASLVCGDIVVNCTFHFSGLTHLDFKKKKREGVEVPSDASVPHPFI